MTAKKKSPLNKAHILGPAGPSSAGPFCALSKCAPRVGIRERLRPSPYYPKPPPEHPPRSTTRHPTDTLEPCTES